MNKLDRVDDMTSTVQYMSDIQNILGEVLWHSVTADQTIESISCGHRDELLKQAKSHLHYLKKPGFFSRKPRLLEVAAYAHVSGYMLAEEGWQVTLSDCSVETLALGARYATKYGLGDERVRRVAVDFHDLPFENGEFDVVYIASALHHTLRWQSVLNELMRVVSSDGILILQNEPINRDFCFYSFETNRPEQYRPLEAELDRQGILQTIAQPYPGSRPESLFGMIENQNMPVAEIVSVIESQGKIEQLDVDTSICMSSFEKKLLKVPRDEIVLTKYIRQELLLRLDLARELTDDVDYFLGKHLPTDPQIDEFSRKAAKAIVSLPDKSSPDYKISLANLFGGALKVVARKKTVHKKTSYKRSAIYYSGMRKGVEIAFPPRLAHVLERTEDLVSDIQTATSFEMEECFTSDDWTYGENKELDYRFVVLKDFTGRIAFRPYVIGESLVVLIRVWADPSAGPFCVALYADEQEISVVDVYQIESFLLNAELPINGTVPNLSVRVKPIKTSGDELSSVPPVSVSAIRVTLIAKD